MKIITKYLCAFLFLLTAAGSSAQTGQKAIDERKLQEYFALNNITPIKAPLGIYYTIYRDGEGRKIMAGEQVTLNYTGKLLDGRVFDSNTDTAFHHTEPLVLEVGTGKAVRGFDKGLQQLKKGSKATIYIPSGLGYGDRGIPGIPANSILVFEVVILDINR